MMAKTTKGNDGWKCCACEAAPCACPTWAKKDAKKEVGLAS